MRYYKCMRVQLYETLARTNNLAVCILQTRGKRLPGQLLAGLFNVANKDSVLDAYIDDD